MLHIRFASPSFHAFVRIFFILPISNPVLNLVLNPALLLLLCIALIIAVPVRAAEPTAAEIVQRCDLDTYAGDDNRSRLTMILSDLAGNAKKNVYRRYWKFYGIDQKIMEKMILFTEFPPDAKGTAFMRWSYRPGAGKNADQWLYLPSLNSVRRVSVRDPGDSFLGSDLTYQDISLRLVEQDEHRLLRVEEKNGRRFYVVESTPKEDKPLYGKVVSWYQAAPHWKDCNKVRVEYYERNGALLKTQSLRWQKVDGAWLWDEVVVENIKTGHSSVFRVTDVEVNVGLKDRLFTVRTLKRGIR